MDHHHEDKNTGNRLIDPVCGMAVTQASKFYEKIENYEIVYFYIVDDIEYKSNVKINLYLELYEKFLKDRVSIFM